MAKVGIVGYGWVGKAMKELFPVSVVYDPILVGTIIGEDDRYVHSVVDDKNLINECDVVFVAVPTPNKNVGSDGLPTPVPDVEGYENIGEGELDTSIVEECVSWIKCPLIVIRSTVNPGTCDYLSKKYNKHIVMQPEYLGETVSHPMTDQKARPFIILGGQKEDTRKLIELYTMTYNANTLVRQVTAREAEIIKLTENRAIAFKVLQCQELYDVCQLDGTDYYTIRDAVYGDDPRFNLWWTFIYPEARGANSKCIPKDVYAWCAFAESLGYEPKITRALLERNKQWINKA